MKPKKPVPTDQELEILKIIWQRGEATVREVYKDLLEVRKIAYTTVLTMMGILEHKGHLNKRPGPKAYIYSPAQPQSQVVGSMVKEFVNRVFDGSAKPLLVHLVKEREISHKEIEEIEQLVRSKRKKL